MFAEKSKQKNPYVSILIVNYNGRHLLEECLTSVFEIDYPKNSFEVILVDNDSQDESTHFIKNNFPDVKLIESQENLGFAGGNNLALNYAKGDYIVLLNNDTKVDKKWLSALVETAQKNKKVGLINSKLYFGIPFVELQINSDIALKADIYGDNDYSPLGVIIEDIEGETEQLSNLVHYAKGFYPPNRNGNYVTRWTNGQATLLLPFTGRESETYSLLVHGHPHTRSSQTKVSVSVGDTVLAESLIQSKSVKKIKISLERDKIYDDLIWLVQNAGNALFKNGLSRDRGAVITIDSNETIEFYDFDTEYYNQQTEVSAVCGASCLIKREVIEQVGLFDEHFFMYYEDVDLSLSAWRLGWDILYEPKSIVYHKHKTSTVQESDVFFSSMILKNHFLLLIKHFPPRMWIKKIVTFAAKLLFVLSVLRAFSYVRYYGRYYQRFAKEVDSRYQAAQGLRRALKQVWSDRGSLKKREVRDFNELAKKLY